MKNPHHSNACLQALQPHFAGFSLCAALLLASLPAQADTIDWLGTTSANMTGTPANWGNSTVPTGTDIARWNAASYTNAPSANAAMTIGQLLFTGNNTGGVTFGLSQPLTLNGVSGTGIQVDSGSGAINTGTVAFKIGGDQSWINNSTSNMTIGGTITNAGNSTAYTLTLGGSGNITTTQVISNGGTVGTLSLTKTGAGKLTLNGLNSTYTGNTTISAGTLSMSTNRIANSGTIFIGDTATLEATSVFSMTNGQKIVGTGATGTISLTSTNLNLVGNNTLSTSGTLNLSSTGRLNVNGIGNEMTGGNITLTGSSARNLQIASGSSISELTISGGTLTGGSSASSADYLGNGAFAGNLIISGGHYVNTAGASKTLSFGSGSTGVGGNLTLNSGSVTIGTLSFETAGNGTSTVNLNGGNLTLAAFSGTAGTSRTINFNGGQLVASGNVTMANTLTLNVNDGGAKINTGSNSVTISGNLVTSGTGGLTKTGSGNLTLSGANTYTGTTTVSAGTLSATGATSLTTSGTLIVDGGSAASAKLSVGTAADFTGKTINITTANGGQYQKDLAISEAYTRYGAAKSSFTGGDADTTASFLAGTTSGAKSVLTSFSSDPASAASNDNQRVSDVFSLSGTGSDTFVLQLSLTTGVSADKYLGYYSGGAWVLANADNTGNNASGAQLGYVGSFSDFQVAYGTTLTAYIGAYGVDTTGQSVWAVLNHNSEFAIVPEPSTWALLAFSLTTVIVFRRRHRRE